MFIKKSRLLLFFAEFLIIHIISLSFVLFFKFTISFLELNFASIRKIAISFIIFVFILIFFLLNNDNYRFLEKIKRKISIHDLNTIVFSVLFYILIFLLFYDTDYTLYGIFGDNIYRISYVEKLRQDLTFQDFFYKNKSAFYSPLYWYLLAICANLLKISSYKILKIGLLFCCLELPFLIYNVWKFFFKPSISFKITSFFFIFIAFEDLYSIDHILSYCFILPYFLFYYEKCFRKDLFQSDIFNKIEYIIGGFIGALLFLNYFYYFLFIGSYLFIKFLKKPKKFVDKHLKHYFYLILITFIFSSIFLIPLAIDIFQYGFDSKQNLYFKEIMIEIPFLLSNLSDITIENSITFLGFFLLIVVSKRTRIEKKLYESSLTIILLFFIGIFSILIRFPIFHIRLIPIFNYINIISFSLFVENIKIGNSPNQNNKNQIYNLKNKISKKSKQLLIFIIIFSQLSIQK